MGGVGSGRRQTPLELKLVRGTVKPSRQRTDSPRPELEIPAAPATLPEAARVHYEYFGRLAKGLGVIAASDAPMLALAAIAQQEVIEANSIIERSGLLLRRVTRYGEGVYANPACALKADALRRLQQALSALGLSPVSRQNVAVLSEQPSEAERRAAEIDKRYF